MTEIIVQICVILLYNKNIKQFFSSAYLFIYLLNRLTKINLRLVTKMRFIKRLSILIRTKNNRLIYQQKKKKPNPMILFINVRKYIFLVERESKTFFTSLVIRFDKQPSNNSKYFHYVLIFIISTERRRRKKKF